MIRSSATSAFPGRGARRGLLALALAIGALLLALHAHPTHAAPPEVKASENPVVIPHGQTTKAITLTWSLAAGSSVAKLTVTESGTPAPVLVQSVSSPPGAGTVPLTVTSGKTYTAQLNDALTNLPLGAPLTITTTLTATPRSPLTPQPTPTPLPASTPTSTPGPGNIIAPNARIEEQVADALSSTDATIGEPHISIQIPPRPLFQMPFFVHQTWMASTYNGHYPNQNSIDLRRYSGTTNVSEGESVVASASGTISEVGPVLSPEGDYYGDYVYIDHEGGWQTRYLHIEKVASWAPGMSIVRGQLVGTVGKYHDMEPHLHYTQLWAGFAFRVVFNGVSINVHKGTEQPDGTYPTQNLTSNNAPTGCTMTGNSVKCSAGAAVRVVVECYLPHTGADVIRRGPWVAAKATSSASCGGGLEMMGASYEVS
jgi:murein DD-endopeptidase MepM/ murein hydrolase activator NlpD